MIDQRARLAPGREQRGYVVTKHYQVLPPTAPVPAPDDVLERVAREGARKMLQATLEAEVDEFLGRRRYQRTQEHRGYRNGYLPERTIGVGMGAVEVSLPRVSDVPPEVSSDGFHSEIVNRYQRRSRTQARLLARLYLEGLASGDFEPVFRALVGETAALSPNSIFEIEGRLATRVRDLEETPTARPIRLSVRRWCVSEGWHGTGQDRGAGGAGRRRAGP